ncbi:MAG: lasso peptide biosynthesis B2 protein [Anaerolineae bacterium]|nr:lasso peptide biosynthesis B2 protein [Anaerolineae bacterium]
MTRLLRRLNAFFRRSNEERWTFFASLALLPALALALNRVGMRRTRAFLEARARLAQSADSTEEAHARARRIARMVNAAARYSPYKANCLKRSLALWWLLRRRGIDSDVRIGVRKAEGTFQAHAWVEMGGVVVNDSPRFVGAFTPFAGDVMTIYRFLD